MNQVYLDTARLLTQVAPMVFVDDTFALKGGRSRIAGLHRGVTRHLSL